MNDIPDHPDIRNAERTGYPNGEVQYPHCPICGAECSTVYYVETQIVGCDECITTGDAWEEDRCFERN